MTYIDLIPIHKVLIGSDISVTVPNWLGNKHDSDRSNAANCTKNPSALLKKTFTLRIEMNYFGDSVCA